MTSAALDRVAARNDEASQKTIALGDPLSVRIRCRGRADGSVRLRALSSPSYFLEVMDPLYAAVRPGTRVRIGIDGKWSHVLAVDSVNPGDPGVSPAVVRVGLGARSGGAFFRALSIELMASGASIDDLMRVGLPIPDLTEHVTVRRATIEERAQIIHLRTLAYRADSKIEQGADAFTDRFDTDAVHLCAFFRGRPVAALRLMLLSREGEWEESRFFDWPNDFPDRERVAGISRACVHPDFRRCRLLVPLFLRAAYELTGAGRTWLLGTATDRLLPMYLRLGAHATSVEIHHGDIGGLKHTVFLADVGSILVGRASALVWLLMWRRAAIALLDDGMLMVEGGVGRWRVRMLRVVGDLIDGFGRFLH